MLSTLLPILFFLPLALSAPAPSQTSPPVYAPPSTPSSPPDYTLPEPYNCGYALTEHNSSTSVSLPAINWCAPIYYNESIPGYQEAWAYSLYGGCRCGFFRYVGGLLWALSVENVREADVHWHVGRPSLSE
ncbi:hypothetical protein NX059_006605 [Plenodomus lindquistii]|nr:hypothetical protein NX059_006605 [Plenodomus lindquistii]